MADKAHRITDEKLEEMEKRLSAIYSRAEKEIGERWRDQIHFVLHNIKKAGGGVCL